MSISELRERLEYQRRQAEQECELKRQANIVKKDKEAEELLSTASKIENARIKRKEENNKRREQKKQDADDAEAKRLAIREKQLVQAYNMINKKKKDKKDEDERLAKELKEIRL